MSGRETSLNAILSFVCGILGFGVLPIIGTIGAIYFGRKAQAEVRGSGETAGGGCLAGLGVFMGYLQALIIVGGLFITVAMWAMSGFGSFG